MPGDPANILYFTERVQATTSTGGSIAGFGTVNQMGKVVRYDTTTRTKTTILDLASRNVVNDDGLHTIAFSPDFNTVGSAGYQKMYVSSSTQGTTVLNRVEEYIVPSSGSATLSRLILQYGNNTQNNHTLSWVGFDPTATGDARNYLHIFTGDGSAGNAVNSGTGTTGKPTQNPSSVLGKVLRVDVSGGDDYDGST